MLLSTFRRPGLAPWTNQWSRMTEAKCLLAAKQCRLLHRVEEWIQVMLMNDGGGSGSGGWPLV